MTIKPYIFYTKIPNINLCHLIKGFPNWKHNRIYKLFLIENINRISKQIENIMFYKLLDVLAVWRFSCVQRNFKSVIRPKLGGLIKIYLQLFTRHQASVHNATDRFGSVGLDGSEYPLLTPTLNPSFSLYLCFPQTFLSPLAYLLSRLHLYAYLNSREFDIVAANDGGFNEHHMHRRLSFSPSFMPSLALLLSSASRHQISSLSFA